MVRATLRPRAVWTRAAGLLRWRGSPPAAAQAGVQHLDAPADALPLLPAASAAQQHGGRPQAAVQHPPAVQRLRRPGRPASRRSTSRPAPAARAGRRGPSASGPRNSPSPDTAGSPPPRPLPPAGREIGSPLLPCGNVSPAAADADQGGVVEFPCPGGLAEDVFGAAVEGVGAESLDDHPGESGGVRRLGGLTVAAEERDAEAAGAEERTGS